MKKSKFEETKIKMITKLKKLNRDSAIPGIDGESMRHTENVRVHTRGRMTAKEVFFGED